MEDSKLSLPWPGFNLIVELIPQAVWHDQKPKTKTKKKEGNSATCYKMDEP